MTRHLCCCSSWKPLANFRTLAEGALAGHRRLAERAGRNASSSTVWALFWQVIRMRSSRLKVVALAVGLALVSAPGWALFDEQKKGEDPKAAAAANPEAQAALDAGLAAVKEADAAAGEGKGKLPAAAKAAYA